jgi:formylmethanofuran dehydrogenase subunit E
VTDQLHSTSLDELLHEAEIAHGHLCAGQVLGVRMAMLGLELLGIEDPKGRDRKRLITFVDLQNDRAVRIAARESSKALARQMHPEIESKNQQQMLAYREMPTDALFDVQWVKVHLPPEELPGYKGERITCARCGEGINFQREVRQAEETLCKACAEGKYYEPV